MAIQCLKVWEFWFEDKKPVLITHLIQPINTHSTQTHTETTHTEADTPVSALVSVCPPCYFPKHESSSVCIQTQWVFKTKICRLLRKRQLGLGGLSWDVWGWQLENNVFWDEDQDLCWRVEGRVSDDGSCHVFCNKDRSGVPLLSHSTSWELLCTLMRSKAYKHIKQCDIVQLLLWWQHEAVVVIGTLAQMLTVLNDWPALLSHPQKFLKVANKTTQNKTEKQMD